MKTELRRRMHRNRFEVAKRLGRVPGGWRRDYAVPTSFPSHQRFVFRLMRLWLRILRSRSQKDRHALENLGRLVKAFWPPVKILQP